jgi:hypothetical protein
MTIPGLPIEKELEYYALVAKVESNNNPKAKNPNSSASGLYQPIKGTWESYGFDWADRWDVGKQNAFIRVFTAHNAKQLVAAGCAVNFATLYGAHFLGPGGLLKVMRGIPVNSIATVTSAAQRKANPSILNGTVKDFCDWLEKKTGDSVYKRYTKGGFVSGPGAVVPPGEAPGDHGDDDTPGPGCLPWIGAALLGVAFIVGKYLNLF